MCLLFIGPIFESREDSTLKTKDLGRAIIVAISLFGGFCATTFAQVTHTELFTFSGDSAGDEFGLSVSGAGDVNGDGTPDLIVGAPGDDNNGIASGSARVLSGLDGSTLFTFDGDSANDFFGDSVSGAGDVNGDGRADLIVGAFGDNNNGSDSGIARVLSGIDGSTLFTFNGDSANDQFGLSVSGAGDVNGDGTPDLIVGALGDDNNGDESGIARVLSGMDGGTLFTFEGDSAFDLFGDSVSGAGDVNGDGFADLIVGAPFDDNNGSDSGSARVLSGIDGSTLFTFDGDSAGDFFGVSVNGLGDLNGDGLDDFVVGSNGFARVFVSSVPVPTAAVPEPSTIAFLSLGFAGFGCRQLRRRKLKQQQAAQILSN